MPRTSARRTALVALVVVVAGLLGIGPLPALPAIADVAASAPTYLPMMTRLSNKVPGTTDSMATMGVRVGSTTSQAYWGSFGATRPCPAMIWLVVIDPVTGAAVYNDNNTGGVDADLCAWGALANAVSRAGQPLPGGRLPLVVVNTISMAPAACRAVWNQPFVVSDLGTQLARLGFTDTATLNGLDLCATSVTGIGRYGLAEGRAWQRGGPAAEDIPAGNPGTFVATATSFNGALVSSASDPTLHFVDFDAKVARRYGGDGTGGWEVDGTFYPFDTYPTTHAGIPPDSNGGFQLVVLTTSGSRLSLVSNTTYWTNTVTAADGSRAALDRQAWHGLHDALADSSHHPERVYLLRNVGSAKASDTVGPDDPAMDVAMAIDRIWGMAESIIQLHRYMSLTIALPGGITPQPIVRTSSPVRTTPPELLPLTYQTGDGKGDPRFIDVELRPQPLGGYFQPTSASAASLTAPDDAYESEATVLVNGSPTRLSTSTSPYAMDLALAQPDSQWPETAQTPGQLGAAYRGWADYLCSCSSAATGYDPRGSFLTNKFSGRWANLRTADYVYSPDYSSGAWRVVGTELAQEMTYAQYVQSYASFMTTVETLAQSTGGSTLVSAMAAVEAQFAADAALGSSDMGTTVRDSVIEGLLVGLSDMPRIGDAVTAGLAGFNVYLYLSDRETPPSGATALTVADLGTFVASRALDAFDVIGVQATRILTDRGRLFAVGYQLQQATSTHVSPWYLPAGQVGQVVTALVNETTRVIYRALLSQFYEVWTTTNGSTVDPVGFNRPFYRPDGSVSKAFVALPFGGNGWGYRPDDYVRSCRPSGSRYCYDANLRIASSVAQDGDWYISGIVRTPISDSPRVPSDALLDRILAAGISMRDIIRQWPMPHVGCSTGIWYAWAFVPGVNAPPHWPDQLLKPSKCER